MVRPILKWAGGKRQLLDELYRRFPRSYEDYHEPFFGGGAIFFDLEPQNGTINDTNIRLINLYLQVRDRPEELLDVLRSFIDPTEPPDANRRFSETSRKGTEITNYYYQQRELYNNRPNGDEFDELEEAALLVYLNRTCYNGLYRENSSGEFNVPIGRYNNPDWVRADEIRKASRVLENTAIHNSGFEYILEEAKNGDLVYCDPPYEPMSPTASFTDYSADGFGIDDQKRLLETAQTLDEHGVFVILSNSGIMFDMYDEAGFYVDIESATRAINSDETNRDEVDEIIATNIPYDKRQSVCQDIITDY